MRRATTIRPALAALAVLGLAACEPPLIDEATPSQRITVVRDGIAYDAVVQFDVFQQAYVSRIYPRMLRDAALTREEAISVVETGIGPQVCEGGGPIAFEEDAAISLFGYTETVEDLSSVGGWQIVARCA